MQRWQKESLDSSASGVATTEHCASLHRIALDDYPAGDREDAERNGDLESIIGLRRTPGETDAPRDDTGSERVKKRAKLSSGSGGGPRHDSTRRQQLPLIPALEPQQGYTSDHPIPGVARESGMSQGS